MNTVTYNNCKTLIEAGMYEYQNMLDVLSLFVLIGSITQEQCLELTMLMVDPNAPKEPAADDQQPITDPATTE